MARPADPGLVDLPLDRIARGPRGRLLAKPFLARLVRDQGQGTDPDNRLQEVFVIRPGGRTGELQCQQRRRGNAQKSCRKALVAHRKRPIFRIKGIIRQIDRYFKWPRGPQAVAGDWPRPDSQQWATGSGPAPDSRRAGSPQASAASSAGQSQPPIGNQTESVMEELGNRLAARQCQGRKQKCTKCGRRSQDSA